MSALSPFFPPGVAGLSVARASGARLWTEDGRSFVDLGISHGVTNLGWTPPEVVAAIRTQADRLLYLGSALDNPVRRDFLARLGSILPARLDRAFLSNSGTEAVEAAIKFARAATGRAKVVAAMRGFHGRTYGALSATWRREFREPFEPLVPGFVHVPFNDQAALAAAVDDATALVLLEPVQGEGGVHVADPEFLRAAREISSAHGALLAWDEVQTGMGRTGRRWGFEHANVEPDLLTAAKGLAGGVPIGATVTTEDVQRRFRGSHHSTFGGSPLACAAGVAAIDVLVRDRLEERAARLGREALDRLSRLPPERVREVRGVGLMIGLECRERVAPYLDRLRDRGFLALSAGPSVLRLLPPLVIPEEDWRAGLDAVEEVLGRG